MRALRSRHAQLGLTMIELLISIAIGLVVVGAVTYMYVGSKGAYRGNEALAQMQDAGRFALDSISRDIRRAGALGCGSRASVAASSANGKATAVIVNMIASGLANSGGQPTPLWGFEPAVYQPLPVMTQPTGLSLPASAPTYWGGDVLQLQIAGGQPVRVTAEDTAAATITLSSNTAPSGGGPYFKQNQYAVLANCSSAAVFQVYGTTTAGPSAVVAYASASVPLTTSGQFSLAADTYPTVLHFDQVTYYIGRVPNSSATALYRYSLSSGSVEELVDNVEDLDVVYGIGNAGAITAFKKPNSPPTMTAADFSNVISVRVSLVAVGDQQGAVPSAQNLLFHGTDANPLQPVAQTVSASDTRLRQVFTATTSLRDRLQ